MRVAKRWSKAVEPIPEGYHSVTTCLTFRDADKAIGFYRKAFGAELLDRMPGPDGQGVMHAVIRIGDSRIFLGDEMPGMECRSAESLGGSPSAFYLYVRNVDEAFRKAVDAGARTVQPLMNAFWGDRYGTVADPFGYQWSLATRVEEVPPTELRKRAAEFFRIGSGPPS